MALTTRVYREAVDKAWAALSSSQDPTSIAGAPQLSDAEWRDLQQVFARGQDGAHTGLTPGFLQGPNHQSLVRGRAPRHRGVFLGKLLDVSPNGNALRVELAAPVRRGDGIVIDQGRPEDDEIGGSVFTIKSPKERQQGQRGRQASSARGRPGSSQGGPVHQAEAGSVVELVLGPAHVDLRSVRPGHLLWKNKDPALEAKIRATYEALSAAQRRRVPVTVQIEAEVGKPLRITLRDSEGRVSSAATEVAGVEATGRPIAPADLEKAVGKHLGDEGSLEASRWDFSGCDFGGETGKGVFYPVTAIKEARRKAVADLLEQQAAGPAVQLPPALSPSVALDNLLEDIRAEGRLWQASQGPGGLAEPTLRVLCRTKAQVDAAAAVPWLSEMILDFLEVHGLKEACATVREAGKRVVVAAPRIIKPDERRLWVFFLKLDADALLVRGAGLLHQLMQLGGPGTQVPDAGGHAVPALEGDFSLNATNVVSADVLLRHGLARLAPTYDCNAQQLVDMARGLGKCTTRVRWHLTSLKLAEADFLFMAQGLHASVNDLRIKALIKFSSSICNSTCFPLPQALAVAASRSSSTPTSPSFTPSTASSRASSPLATPTWTAATPASTKQCTSETPLAMITWSSQTQGAETRSFPAVRRVGCLI